MWKNVLVAAVFALAIAFILFQSRPPAPVASGTAQPTPFKDPLNQPTLDRIRKPALDWNIPAKYWMNTGGKPIRLADLRGKVTLVEFFRIDCPHCKAAAPEMIEIYNALKPHGLNIVAMQAPGVAADEANWTHVQATLRDWGIPYPVAFDQGSKEFKKNGFIYYPTVIILDKQGVVRFAQSGYDEKEKRRNLLDALYNLLGLTPATVPPQLAVGANP